MQSRDYAARDQQGDSRVAVVRGSEHQWRLSVGGLPGICIRAVIEEHPDRVRAARSGGQHERRGPGCVGLTRFSAGL